MNLVLDDVKEVMRGRLFLLFLSLFLQSLHTSFSRAIISNVNILGNLPDDEGNETTRSLGLVVARGTLLVLISPADGSEEIPNPFVQPEE